MYFSPAATGKQTKVRNMEERNQELIDPDQHHIRRKSPKSEWHCRGTEVLA